MAELGVTTYRRFTEEFRRRAVSRLDGCENISALCRELGISRQLLYQWKHRSERGLVNRSRASGGEDLLRRRVAELEHAVEEMRLQMDDSGKVLRRVLYWVETLRQARQQAGCDAGRKSAA